jgi:hypothetical protein
MQVPTSPRLPYTIEIDSALGVARIKVESLRGLPEAQAYIEALTQIVRAQRSSHGRVKMLIDRRGSGAFAQDVANRFAEFGKEFFTNGDRLAFIVNSTILKLQLDRVLTKGVSRSFLSIDEAEQWLNAVP